MDLPGPVYTAGRQSLLMSPAAEPIRSMVNGSACFDPFASCRILQRISDEMVDSDTGWIEKSTYL